MDMTVFQAVIAAKSLADVADNLKGVWRQYDAVQYSHAQCAQCQRSEWPSTVAVLSKAASHCLTLLHQEGGIDQEGVIVMPRQPATVSTVPMVLHILAYCTGEWMTSLRSNAQAFKVGSSKVEQAVRQAGECAACASSAAVATPNWVCCLPHRQSVQKNIVGWVGTSCCRGVIVTPCITTVSCNLLMYMELEQSATVLGGERQVLCSARGPSLGHLVLQRTWFPPFTGTWFEQIAANRAMCVPGESLRGSG